MAMRSSIDDNNEERKVHTVEMFEKKLAEISNFVLPYLNRCGYHATGSNLLDLNNLKPNHFNGFVRKKDLGLVIENVDP